MWAKKNGRGRRLWCGGSVLLRLSLSVAAGCASTQPKGPPASAAPPQGMGIMKTQKIMFVHGMFVTPACWRDWQSHFEARGYQTLAPAWPQHDIPIADQRGRHPSAELGAVTLADLLARYREALRGLDEKPILIGHSMDGLIVQLLLQENLGTTNIAIDSTPPKNIISLKYSFLKNN